ncbi:MAG: aldolase/citrate lyase family protein [Chloroflexota bacterium]|nr:aldolase/citrate lyase family protein [Chloroflexota bacterium]
MDRLRDSPLATRLRSGVPLTGLLAKMPCAAQVEAAGHSGFDIVVLDTEHGPAGNFELEHHLRAADAAGIPALVRVPGHEASSILAALDAGASGIIAPHVLDGSGARAVVAAAHYPPRGRRGLALSTRAGRYGAVALTEHLIRAAAETIVVVQIEDAEAVDAAAEILATDGVDAVLIGSNDLAMSLGHPGASSHPEVVRAIDRVVGEAAGAGIAVAVVVGSAAEARTWRARGAGMVLFVATQLVHTAFVTAAREGRATATAVGPEPLLLLPGTIADADLWTDVMAKLADAASPRIARIDLDDSIADMAESVLAAAPGRFALAGHSMGAIVCLEIMRRAPERVTRLALLNASARPADDASLEAWAGMLKRVEDGGFGELVQDFAKENLPAAEAGDVMRGRVEAMARRVGREGLLRQLAAQRSRPDSRPSLGSIACRTLVIAGSDDRICPSDLQEEIASAIPGARLELIESCGHMAPLERPDEVAALLRRWLAEGTHD